jgi:dihydrofolate reductase
VLTHHARKSIEMKGGTTFHFVTDGVRAALERAKHAAGDKDVRVGGGVATVRAYLEQALVDEAHFALRPVLLGRGEAVFAGLDLRALGYQVADTVHGERATHVFIRR